MYGLSFLPILAVGSLAVNMIVLMPVHVLAYIGPGQGLEYLPQLLAMLAMVGSAVLAILLWPVTTLIRVLRGRKQTPQLAVQSPAASANGSQPVGGDNHQMQAPELEPAAVQQQGVVEQPKV